MKRHLLVVIATLGAVMSCTVEGIVETVHDSLELEFNAVWADNKGTKTALQDDGKAVWWTVDEEINAFYGSQFSGRFTSTNTESKATVSFLGSLNVLTGTSEADSGAKAYWAIYPYNEANTCDGSSVTLSLSAEQQAVAGSFADKFFPAVAKSMSLDLAFYNVCGGARFSVARDDIRSIVFKSANGAPLAGKVRVRFSSSGVPEVAEVIDGVDSVVVTAQGKCFVPGELYFAAMLPGTLAGGFELEFENSANYKAIKKIETDITVRRSVFGKLNNVDAGVSFGSDETEIIAFADADLKAVLIAAFDTSGDGELSKAEAAAVSSIAGVFGDANHYTSFNEFKYFTGVSAIPANCFFEWEQLESIVLPESITSIGQQAFYGCTSLREIVIPSGVTSINDRTFRGCTSLASITLPDTVTSIGVAALSHCTSLTSIDLPESLTAIGDNAFYVCSALESITIPDSVTSIGQKVFTGCDNLAEITIGSCFTTISYLGSKNVQKVTLLPGLTSLVEGAFSGCKLLTSVNLPEGLTAIEKKTFYGCESIASISIPEGVTSIGEGAFSGCSSLASIDIPSGVTYFGSNAFSDCASLTSIDLPAGITSIEFSLLSGSGITSITIPDGVTSVGGFAFYRCEKLEYVSLPDGVTEIGRFAFSSCPELKSIQLPDSITTIGDRSFSHSGLTSISFPENLTTIAGESFMGCINLTSLTIPDTVTEIQYWAFYHCTALESVKLPKSIKKMDGGSIFAGCTALSNVELEEGLTCLGDYMFIDCPALSSIIIPESMQELGTGAFFHCSGLQVIEIRATTPPSCDYLTFSGTGDCPIYVPAGSVDAYKASEGWSEYADRIQAIP